MASKWPDSSGDYVLEPTKQVAQHDEQVTEKGSVGSPFLPGDLPKRTVISVHPGTHFVRVNRDSS